MSATISAPTDAASFRQGLSIFLTTAEQNGLQVNGCWDCTNDDGEVAWDVEIVAVRREVASPDP